MEENPEITGKTGGTLRPSVSRFSSTIRKSALFSHLIFQGRKPCLFFKLADEIACGSKSGLNSDFRDAVVCVIQQKQCLGETVFVQIIRDGHIHHLLKISAACTSAKIYRITKLIKNKFFLIIFLQEIMNSGEIYKVADATDPHYYEYLQMMETYNSLGYTDEGEKEKRRILKELFAEVGENCYIQAPYHAMWGGHNVHLGNNVYINFNCTSVDDAQIYIGDHTMIAPNATIIAASHPVSPSLRKEGYGCNKPVHIGKNVWIASNVTILPGVTIGDHSIIGAGSVVTKDIPPNVIAFGHPAEVHREITEEDEIFYDHGKRISEHIVLDIHG